MSCHAKGPVATTCGEWKAAVAEGKRLLEEEAMIGSIITADDYNRLWIAWGDLERPGQAEFEARVRERYGFQYAPFPNPYPLPGEDPAATGGGSGRLPMGLVQTKDENGNYDGGIAGTCLLCHAGRIFDESIVGLGNSTFDFSLFGADTVVVTGHVPELTYPLNQTRGSIDADTAAGPLLLERDFDTLDRRLSPFTAPTTLPLAIGVDQDAPNWWNRGSRPNLFSPGAAPADNQRTFMAFLMTNRQHDGEEIMKWEDAFASVNAYLDSLEPPPYPGTIDTDCSDEICVSRGAEIFHEENLFARLGQEPPIGNGSCSSCHGIHHPDYENDDTVGNLHATQPLFVSGQIVPTNVIGTDPGVADNFGPATRTLFSTTWFGYADNRSPTGNPLEEQLNDFNPFRSQGECSWQQEAYGYSAPPLLGVWASAPYFHNGSVPDVWGVLDPSRRPRFWRRQLSSTPAGPERGFSTSADAYDSYRLGWKYDEVEPAASGVPVYVGGNVAPVTRFQIEERKIYDTRIRGKSNAGHAFTIRLDNWEREALIEFLKTL